MSKDVPTSRVSKKRSEPDPDDEEQKKKTEILKRVLENTENQPDTLYAHGHGNNGPHYHLANTSQAGMAGIKGVAHKDPTKWRFNRFNSHSLSDWNTHEYIYRNPLGQQKKITEDKATEGKAYRAYEFTQPVITEDGTIKHIVETLVRDNRADSTRPGDWNNTTTYQRNPTAALTAAEVSYISNTKMPPGFYRSLITGEIRQIHPYMPAAMLEERETTPISSHTSLGPPAYHNIGKKPARDPFADMEYDYQE